MLLSPKNRRPLQIPPHHFINLNPQNCPNKGKSIQLFITWFRPSSPDSALHQPPESTSASTHSQYQMWPCQSKKTSKSSINRRRDEQHLWCCTNPTPTSSQCHKPPKPNLPSILAQHPPTASSLITSNYVCNTKPNRQPKPKIGSQHQYYNISNSNLQPELLNPSQRMKQQLLTHQEHNSLPMLKVKPTPTPIQWSPQPKSSRYMPSKQTYTTNTNHLCSTGPSLFQPRIAELAKQVPFATHTLW